MPKFHIFSSKHKLYNKNGLQLKDYSWHREIVSIIHAKLGKIANTYGYHFDIKIKSNEQIKYGYLKKL